jgi:hypothetical protein
MINAELLYKLKQAGYTYKEVGVHHLPRQAGRATGANLPVILRAFRELFVFAPRWHSRERDKIQAEVRNTQVGDGSQTAILSQREER